MLCSACCCCSPPAPQAPPADARHPHTLCLLMVCLHLVCRRPSQVVCAVSRQCNPKCTPHSNLQTTPTVPSTRRAWWRRSQSSCELFYFCTVFVLWIADVFVYHWRRSPSSCELLCSASFNRLCCCGSLMFRSCSSGGDLQSACEEWLHMLVLAEQMCHFGRRPWGSCSPAVATPVSLNNA